MEEPRAVFGRKASHVEFLKIGEIDQGGIAQALGIAFTTTWNVLEKERNHWLTEQQTIEPVNQGKQQQLMTETLCKL